MPTLSEFLYNFFSFSENLSPLQLWLVMALAFVFFLYLVYRILGIGGLLGIVVLAFFAFVLHEADYLGKYQDKKKKEIERMKIFEDELGKDPSKDI